MGTEVYIGKRDSKGNTLVIRADRHGYETLLMPRRDLRDHSPDGFEWSYNGSGPAQLALAILADFFGPEGEESALALYQEFKAATIAALPKPGWQLTRGEVAAIVDRLLARREARKAGP